MTGGVLRRPRRGCRSEIRRSLTRRLLPRRCWSTRNACASIFVVFRVTEWPRRLCLLAVAVWLGASGSAAAIGQPERAIRTAMQAYRAGDFEAAAGAFADAADLRPDNARLLYNAGAAAYRHGDLSGARHLLQESINSGASDQLATAGHLALGHTWMAEAEQLAEAGPGAALPALEGAIESYQRTLRMAPRHDAAAYHLEQARAWLAELQQQQNQQQSQGDQGQQPEQEGDQEQREQQQQQADQEQQPQQPQQPDAGGADQSEAAPAPAATADGGPPEQDADAIAGQIIAAEEAIAALLDRRRRQLEPVARDW